MISDFLSLKLDRRTESSENYICYLPDPDIYGECRMIACGHIELIKNCSSGKCIVKIRLDDNFESLCVGDTYQRRAFLMTVFYLLRQNTDFMLEHARIILKDYIGSYIGVADGQSSAEIKCKELEENE